jgi:ABC-type antimicrobial peptide transport system permease subunit
LENAGILSAILALNPLKAEEILPKNKKIRKPVVLSTWRFGIQANEEAWKVLSQGGKALDAVEKGVRLVEDDPNERSVGYGVTQNRFKNYKLEKGKYPLNNEVIVGKSIFEQLSNRNEVQIANKTFKISGVFESEIGFENGGIVLNISDAGEIFNKSASMILVNTALNSDIEEIIKEIKTLSKDIDVKSTQNFVDNYNQFKIIKTSSNVISFIAFFLGLLGIVSLMSITVNQRKSEFGIKKALGIKTSKIVYSIII